MLRCWVICLGLADRLRLQYASSHRQDRLPPGLEVLTAPCMRRAAALQDAEERQQEALEIALLNRSIKNRGAPSHAHYDDPEGSPGVWLVWLLPPVEPRCWRQQGPPGRHLLPPPRLGLLLAQPATSPCLLVLLQWRQLGARWTAPSTCLSSAAR